MRPSHPLRRLLRHPAARWGGALLAAILVVGQILLLQHRVEHVGGTTTHCDVCVAGKALEHAGTPAAVTLPAGTWTDVAPLTQAPRVTRADALSPRARGPPSTSIA